MEKKLELKDYLHFYLGCEIQFPDKSVSKLSAVCNTHNGMWISAIDYSLPLDGGWWHPVSAIKPILRPLSDMTEEEAKECYFLIHNCKATDSPFDTLQYIISALEDETSSKVWLWAIKKGFDVFGLIEAGLAINKTIPEVNKK